jgi:hypothetical protein
VTVAPLRSVMPSTRDHALGYSLALCERGEEETAQNGSDAD